MLVVSEVRFSRLLPCTLEVILLRFTTDGERAKLVLEIVRDSVELLDLYLFSSGSWYEVVVVRDLAVPYLGLSLSRSLSYVLREYELVEVFVGLP